MVLSGPSSVLEALGMRSLARSFRLLAEFKPIPLGAEGPACLLSFNWGLLSAPRGCLHPSCLSPVKQWLVSRLFCKEQRVWFCVWIAIQEIKIPVKLRVFWEKRRGQGLMKPKATKSLWCSGLRIQCYFCGCLSQSLGWGMGSIPGLVNWVKDMVLLQLWFRL